MTPEPPAVRSAGVFAREDDLWMVTLIGHLGEQPPDDLEGFTRYAASLPMPEIAELLSTAEAAGEPATAQIVDVPWTMAASSDLRFPQVPGVRTTQIRILNAYVARLLVTARHDRIVAQAFARTNNLLDTPQSLLRPAIAARLLLGGSTHTWMPAQRTGHHEQKAPTA